MPLTEREQVVEVLNRLFYYTDHQQWDKLKSEVFDREVLMDMTSLGASKAEIWSAERICDEWEQGFENLDSIHHQSGNYMIEFSGSSANAKAYAIASHYKKDASQGSTREFIGSYDFILGKTKDGWKLNSFKFNLKYMKGNLELE